MQRSTQKASTQKVLVDPESFATTLLVLFLDIYGPEALQWSPETIRLELEDDFHIKMPNGNFDKLMAAVHVVTSDDFYTNTDRFIHICNVLSGSNFDPTVFDPADAKECAWGITEALLLWPPSGDSEEFSDDIRRYLGVTLDWEGIREAPDVLKLAIRDTSTGAADYSSMTTADPDMFGAEWDMQASRSEEISQMLRENLNELFSQLAELQLSEGSTDELLQRVSEQFRDR